MAKRTNTGELTHGRLRRAAPAVGLTTRTAVGRIGASLRRRLGNDEALAQFHEKNAQRYADYLSNSRGALMKAGQLLSYIDPPALTGPQDFAVYQQAFSSLRTSAEPMAFDLIAAVIETELGQPVETVFVDFGREPIAAASIGQVHRATTRDGDVVAVKVQYPGVAEAIDADLANTELLATMIKLAQSALPKMPRLDARAVAAELGDRLRDELDYVRERENIERFAALYAEQPGIRIPSTHPDLSSARVLTMQFVDGLSWEEALVAPQHLRDSWGDAINRFFFRSIYRAGLFHADPHPGNYVFHPDGSVTILDFGCVSALDAESLAGFVEIAESTIAGDAERLATVMRRTGFIGEPGPDPEALLAYYRPTFECMVAPQPFRMTRDFTTGVLDTLNPYGEQGDISRAFALPPKFMLTTRIYVGLFSVLAALEAEADWLGPYQDDVRYYHAHKDEIAVTV